MVTRQPRRPDGDRTRDATARLSVKVPADVKDAAARAADANGETLSLAVVRFLHRYGAAHRS